MSISALDAAAHLCKTSNWTIPNTRLHKLLYLCNLNQIGKTGDPLIRESFYSTDFGPLIPALHKKCSCFGARPIKNIFWAAKPVTGPAKSLLDMGLRTTQNWTGGQMVAATHREIGAWAKCYVPGAKVLIDNQLIIDEYNAIVNQPSNA